MKLLEDCRNLLNERMSELLQLAEDCLMILYLEIRVQCYYHLLIVLRKVCYQFYPLHRNLYTFHFSGSLDSSYLSAITMLFHNTCYPCNLGPSAGLRGLDLGGTPRLPNL